MVKSSKAVDRDTIAYERVMRDPYPPALFCVRREARWPDMNARRPPIKLEGCI